MIENAKFRDLEQILAFCQKLRCLHLEINYSECKMTRLTFSLPLLKNLCLTIFNQSDTKSKNKEILIQTCPSLKLLKVVQDKRLNLIVSDCNEVTDFSVLTDYPEQINFGSLIKLKAFTLDLSCNKCILELDRFDVRVFYFATAACQLESFLMRTGKSDTRVNYDNHKRYQAVKWEVNKATKFDVTHSIDLNKVKAYIGELFPFMSDFLSRVDVEDKVRILKTG